jgi:hypothetical protein
MEEKAVVDRIEDDQLAVLLVGERERELVVPAERLPAGATAGTWLRVRLEGDELLEASIDADETERAAERISDKLARLRQRGRHLRPE